MKKLLSVLMLLSCAACGEAGEEDNNNHGYGYEYDVHGASGLLLRYTPIIEAGDQYADVTWYETEFERMKQCAGLSAPPPFVILVKPGELGQFVGLHIDPSLILFDITYPFILAHEMIHHLLYHSTGDGDKNHNSPLFGICV